MAETQAEADDELRIAARRVLRAARARPSRREPKSRTWRGALVFLLPIGLAIAGLILIVHRL